MGRIQDRLKAESADWPVWFRGLTPFRKYFPAVFVALYLPTLVALGGLRSDHVLMCAFLLALSYGGRSIQPFFGFILPLILTGIVYDSQRFYGDLIRARVRVEEPYYFDKRFFGITTEQGVLTPNEWWQLHTHPILDLYTGFFYLAFIGIFVLIAAYFVFWLSRKGTAKLSASEIAWHAPKLMWGFFWLNILGYTTYYWYPAAPPWYVTLHGLGPAKMDTLPNPAGCIRFDELLGTNFFTGFYGRSADVFGAIPSLHIAYPLLAVYFAFRFGALQKFSVLFFISMCFSAVYLNHHYILDLIWGAAYTIIIGVAMDWWWARKKKRTTAAAIA